MKYKVFEKEIVAILETGEHIHDSISEICQTENIGMGTVTGFGGIRYAKMGIWNNERGQYDYLERTDDSTELLSLNGNISWLDHKPNIHIHVSAADNNFQVFGGHLVEGIVQNLVELYIYPGSEKIERVPYKSWFFMDL